MKISKKELTFCTDSLRDFLKTFDHASKCLQIPLPKPEVEIGSTKSKDNLFAHYYKDIIKYPNGQLRLKLGFGNNNFCVLSIKMFGLQGKKLILTEVHRFFNNRYYVANKCEKNESNYDVERIDP